MRNKFNYIFGPVISRRLGISLGVDVIPYKTCNLNCIYCECGFTKNHTNTRKEYIKSEEIISELNIYLKEKPQLDYITFSGGGEPLLNSGIFKIAKFIKYNYSEYKLCLITNGILLSEQDIQENLNLIDLLIPSLDAGKRETFKMINRPHKDVDFDRYINGLVNLKKIYKNEIWLEVFIVKGINDSEESLKSIKKIIEKINPDKIQLNTIDRPPAEEDIEPVDDGNLLKIKDFFGKKCEIINFSKKQQTSLNINNIDVVLNSLSRRPLTLDDIQKITGLSVNEINKILSNLKKDNKIEEIKEKRGIFFSLKLS